MDSAFSQLSLLDRMVAAVKCVRERLNKTVAALEGAKVPYAVTGSQAVAAWVATVDEAAVRNTPDVDILLRRVDIEAASRAMEAAGFLRRHVAGTDLFLEMLNAKTRDAVRVLIAGEAAAAEIIESERFPQFFVVKLQPLVRMKLFDFRRVDRVDLRDMLDVGLLDQSWLKRFSEELRVRLQHLIDTPGQ